jgi:hypothetical protein
MYTLSITTAIPTLSFGVRPNTATLARMKFETYEAACIAAQQYATANGVFYVAPATQAPTLKEGQEYIEVTIA